MSPDSSANERPFGSFLHAMIAKAEITQKALLEKVGKWAVEQKWAEKSEGYLPQPTLSNWLSGRQLPSAEDADTLRRLKALAGVLNVGLDALLQKRKADEELRTKRLELAAARREATELGGLTESGYFAEAEDFMTAGVLKPADFSLWFIGVASLPLLTSHLPESVAAKAWVEYLKVGAVYNLIWNLNAINSGTLWGLFSKLSEISKKVREELEGKVPDVAQGESPEPGTGHLIRHFAVSNLASGSQGTATSEERGVFNLYEEERRRQGSPETSLPYNYFYPPFPIDDEKSQQVLKYYFPDRTLLVFRPLSPGKFEPEASEGGLGRASRTAAAAHLFRWWKTPKDCKDLSDIIGKFEDAYLKFAKGQLQVASGKGGNQSSKKKQ